MKDNGLDLCRLNVEFIRYTEMIDSVYYLLNDDANQLIKKLTIDLDDLISIERTLKQCLYECKKQITFVEGFLSEVNYVKKNTINN